MFLGIGFFFHLFFEFFFELILCLIVGHNHNQIRVELVNWQQLIIVLEDIQDLFGLEGGDKVDQKGSVILQDGDSKSLKHMFQLEPLFHLCLNHNMQRVLFLLVRIQLSLHNLHEHLHQRTLVNPVQLTIVNPPVRLFQLYLPKQKVVLYVLF